MTPRHTHSAKINNDVCGASHVLSTVCCVYANSRIWAMCFWRGKASAGCAFAISFTTIDCSSRSNVFLMINAHRNAFHCDFLSYKCQFINNNVLRIPKKRCSKQRRLIQSDDVRQISTTFRTNSHFCFLFLSWPKAVHAGAIKDAVLIFFFFVESRLGLTSLHACRYA